MSIITIPSPKEHLMDAALSLIVFSGTLISSVFVVVVVVAFVVVLLLLSLENF